MIEMKKKYIYLMQYDEIKTISFLALRHIRICDRRFWLNRHKRGEHFYYGWIATLAPLHLFDAMEAGLVPIFRIKGEHVW